MPILNWSEVTEEITDLEHFTPEEKLMIINCVYEDYEKLAFLSKHEISQFDKNVLLLYKKILGLLIKKHGH